jgi:hypothetical protein
LLRAGIDVFAHMIDTVDDELVALFVQHPNAVVLPTLAAPRLLTTYAPWLNPLDPLLAITQPADHVTQLRDRLAATRPESRGQACGLVWAPTAAD